LLQIKVLPIALHPTQLICSLYLVSRAPTLPLAYTLGLPYFE